MVVVVVTMMRRRMTPLKREINYIPCQRTVLLAV
jgi:hypothetical protein